MSTPVQIVFCRVCGHATGGDGSRQPSENELAIARYQGWHVATIAAQLKRGRG
jgi:hypothetical protein